MKGKDEFSFLDKSGELEHYSYSERAEGTEGIVVGMRSSLKHHALVVEMREAERRVSLCAKGEHERKNR